jgi:Zn-dependent protease with chaperone function
MECIIQTATPEQSAVQAELTRPTDSYRRSARLAAAGLLAFVLLYFGLAAWFLLSAWHLVRASQHGGNGFANWCAAIVAVLLAVVMLKAIFAVRHAMPPGMVELKRDEQPRLFDYLMALADTAGAPRPHRVFLSNRVNAAVFYDLSLLNLIFPSKKNLEIGLPLVNAMPLGELRAVLAHEFGHFAQRSMAVGRWTYVAQQVVQEMVARRDALDEFIEGIGRLDIRLRVLAWSLQILVWSLRSLVEQAFRLVVLMQRALSREMEMQADLVAPRDASRHGRAQAR